MKSRRGQRLRHWANEPSLGALRPFINTSYPRREPRRRAGNEPVIINMLTLLPVIYKRAPPPFCSRRRRDLLRVKSMGSNYNLAGWVDGWMGL